MIEFNEICPKTTKYGTRRASNARRRDARAVDRAAGQRVLPGVRGGAAPPQLTRAAVFLLRFRYYARPLSVLAVGRVVSARRVDGKLDEGGGDARDRAGGGHREDRLEVAHVAGEAVARDAAAEDAAVVVEVDDAALARAAVVHRRAAGEAARPPQQAADAVGAAVLGHRNRGENVSGRH